VRGAAAEWESVAKDEKLALGEELYRRGLQHLWAEDCENGPSLFIESLENNPKLESAYFQIGYCLRTLADMTKRLKSIKGLSRIKPDDADVTTTCASLITCWVGLTRPSKPANKLFVSNPISPKPTAISVDPQKLGKYTEGIEFCKQAIRIKPDHALAHYNLGNNYAGLARFEEALESYKQAIRNNPDYAEAHLNLGAAYNQLGRYEEAIDSYKQAFRIKPRSRAHPQSGMTYINSGTGAPLDEYKVLKDQDAALAISCSA